MKQNNVAVVFFFKKKNALEWETKDITSHCFAAVSTPILLQDQPVSEGEGQSFKSACVFDFGLDFVFEDKEDTYTYLQVEIGLVRCCASNLIIIINFYRKLLRFYITENSL